MSTYDHTFFTAVPDTLRNIAKRISRALDPDVGGFDAFELEVLDAQGKSWFIYETPCVESFMMTAQYLVTSPMELQNAVAMDYMARWGDFVAEIPTLEEVTNFLAMSYIFFDTPLQSALEQAGLTLKGGD